LTMQALFDLYLHRWTRTLFARTHGRSMWQLNLSEIPTAVGAPAAVAKLALSAPSPNPSSGAVSFTLSLTAGSRAQVSVFDAQGRKVRMIHDGSLAAGRHGFTWDGRDAAGRAARAG